MKEDLYKKIFEHNDYRKIMLDPKLIELQRRKESTTDKATIKEINQELSDAYDAKKINSEDIQTMFKQVRQIEAKTIEIQLAM